MKGERTEVRRWTIKRDHSDIGGEQAVAGVATDWVEVLEAAPLLASLEQLAGEWTKRALDQRRARSSLVAIALDEAVRELRSLIQSLNPQEVDTNAG